MSDINEQMPKEEDVVISQIEDVYNDTVNQVKQLEQEQKKIISDFLKSKEKDKIEEIRKSLLN